MAMKLTQTVHMVLILLIALQLVDCRRDVGSIQSKTGSFKLISRFAFGSMYTHEYGKLDLKVTAGDPLNPNYIVIYDESSYNTAKQASVACEVKDRVASYKFPAPIDHTIEICEEYPHWMYIVALDCEHGLDLHYDIHMTNPGPVWSREVSYDEQGLFEQDIFALALSIGLTAAAAASLSIYLVRSRVCPYAIIGMLISTSLYTFSTFVDVVDGLQLVWSGRSFILLAFVADLTDVLSQIAFMAVLLLTIAGASVLQVRTDLITVGLVALFLALLGTAQVLSFMWSVFGMDAAEAAYSYASPAGVLYLVMRAVGLFLFIFLGILVRREKNFGPRVRILFMLGFSGWFILHAVFVIAGSLLPTFYRAKVVLAAMTFTDLIFPAILLAIHIAVLRGDTSRLLTIGGSVGAFKAPAQQAEGPDADGLLDDEDLFEL